MNLKDENLRREKLDLLHEPVTNNIFLREGDIFPMNFQPRLLVIYQIIKNNIPDRH